MKLLLVTATSGELGPVSKKLGLQENDISSGNITWLSTGVGMVNTTFRLTKTLLSADFDLVINAGISGAFDKRIQIGEVVNVSSDMFSELGAEDHDNFLDISELKLAHPDEFPFEGNEIKGEQKVPGLPGIRNVRGITVNTVHGNEERILKTSKRLNPQVESMEGAAVMFCCKQLKKPFYQIRCISNYVEPRNRDSWNIPLAVKNLNEAIENIINNVQ